MKMSSVAICGVLLYAFITGASAQNAPKAAPKGAPKAAPKAAPQAPPPSNSKMPDIVGVHLDVPAREAFATLQAAYPNIKLAIDPLNLPMIAQPILNGFNLGYTPQSVLERIVVSATPPPDR